jgi:hypothetical protein
VRWWRLLAYDAVHGGSIVAHVQRLYVIEEEEEEEEEGIDSAAIMDCSTSIYLFIS